MAQSCLSLTQLNEKIMSGADLCLCKVGTGLFLQEFKSHEPNTVYPYSNVSFHLIRNRMRRKCISSILIKYYSVQI